MSVGTRGQSASLVSSGILNSALSTWTPVPHTALHHFDEFFKGFIALRDNIARQKAYAHVEHSGSPVIRAMSIFKLSSTSRWALMAARG